jgi:uncharacterized protein YqhQ
MPVKQKTGRLWTRLQLTFMALPTIGGQAVIEGVMMRSPKSFVVAVRKANGSIVVRERPWLSFSERFSFLKWPILRGANMLIESMYNGMNALQFSAEQAATESEAEANQEKGVSKTSLAFTLILSMLLGILIFKGVPHFTAYAIGEFFGKDGHSALPIMSVGFHLVDGAIKMTIFIGYILLISRMADVKRLFMYHGAEHKAVHAYEKGLNLDVDDTRIQSTAHPRCGTSLILLVISVSIVVFAATIPLLPVVSENTLVQALFSLVVKVPLMLPVAGVAYEFQRAAAKNPNNVWVKMFIAPGMLMQRLTTREPTDEQLEISLTALRKALWRESVAEKVVAKSDDIIETFDDFATVQRSMA